MAVFRARMGWQRVPPLWSRGPADLVLALALQHHVVLTRHVPCDMLLATLARLGRNCLLEFIDPRDAQAQRLRAHLGEGHQRLPERRSSRRWWRGRSASSRSRTHGNAIALHAPVGDTA